MRERFKQRQPKRKINKWWVIGAIATPVSLWMGWWLGSLLNRRHQPDYGHLSHNERATLTRQHRETFVRGIGAITTVAGGVFLFLKFRIDNRNLEIADLSDTDLSGIDLSGVDLNGANLDGANLRDANLRGADLSGANLSDARLSGANLRDAKLRGDNLI
ncbi:MAG: pentapeptide repeat-containing protein [Cyanophyceae cyanobacterium]